ncbi:MAG TPA: xanthine dehydrogenase family protein subunit M [Acidimicrobiia bacterium]|nr:xanthine dehydrogenase family protein subunit M [Acidimicrobiia bacterium]
MYPRPFEYVRADSVEQALSLKSETGGRFIAGGHSLLPMMKIRMTAPDILVDIGRIDDLRGISANGGFSIGALTTHTMVASESADGFPAALSEAASMIGDPQVRNRGTVGGNVAHADPASDLPTVFSALGATMTAASAGGSTRDIAASDFFTGMFESALNEDELLTTIGVDAEGSGRGSAYAKLFNPASRYAVVGACAVVDVDDDGSCASCKVAVGGLTPKATLLASVASAMVGNPVNEETSKSAAQAAIDEVGDDILGDVYAGVDYRRDMLAVFVARALNKAASRAR